MSFSISLNINLKNNSEHLAIENMIKDCANNTNVINIYNDFELEGINNYIKKNNIIIILEYDNINFFCNFINFMREIIKYNKTIHIEYIYDNNNILYATKKYINSLNSDLINKENLYIKIEENSKNPKYKRIYNLL